MTAILLSLSLLLACVTSESTPPAPPESAIIHLSPEGGLPYSQTAYAQHGANYTTAPPTLSASATANAVTVSIDGLNHVCKPAPVFEIAAADSLLTLTVKKPEGAVTRCAGPHDVTLAVDDLPAALSEVVLLNTAGDELGRVAISR